MTAIVFDQTFEAEPGVLVDVAPLVRRMTCNNPSPYTFRGTNTYVVGRGAVAIIDPGPDHEAHFAALQRGLAGESISHIVLTHSHVDHSPLAARLQQATGAPVVGGPAVPFTQASGLDGSIDHTYQPDRVVADGETISGAGWTLACVATPGHMSNHFCYGLGPMLFSGDHVMSWATSVVAPPEGHMASYLASLRKLLEREDEMYWPGHGAGRAKPQPLVRAILAHRRQREEALLHLIRAGVSRLPDLVARVYPDLDSRLVPAASLTAQAHLQHLQERGLVTMEGDHILPVKTG
jgi:glyoxylase-like metal-dependent hydrolase (beta-lactamase superfamily II)